MMARQQSPAVRFRVVVLVFWAGVSTAVEADSFSWNRETLFQSLEQQFVRARREPKSVVRPEYDSWKHKLGRSITSVTRSGPAMPVAAMQQIEESQFRIAALSAAHQELLPEAHALITAARLSVMSAARHWPYTRPDVHEWMYRVVYGGRAAIEEALMQQHGSALPTLTRLEDVPSASPSTDIAGIRVHSGDIVLSRGDAATSALIARGNAFPGNFSHVAIVHVDEATRQATVIESLIEHGGVTTPASEFLREKRLRLMLLRLRPDHPVLKADPLAAHKAATKMLTRIRARHVPYDFRMDWHDDSRMFCSEVVHHAYGHIGIDLWAYRATLTSPGLVRWLGDMGVREFTTLVPSDIEYDPRLAPVAEWRNADTLEQDRLDNVTLDVLLEDAETGTRLGFSAFNRVPGSLVKAWSGLEAVFGATPTVPEGMSVDTVLRVRSLIKYVHPRLRTSIVRRAKAYRALHGHSPPYWTLTELARQALADKRASLAPWLVAADQTNGSDGNRGQSPQSQ